MEGHEHLREAIRQHLMATLPAQLAALRVRLGVSSPPDPVAYLLADTLTVKTAYPVVLVRTMSAGPIVDAGDGDYVARYQVEVVAACEVRTSLDYEAASVERDRLSLAIRWALLGPSPTLPGDVTVMGATLTEDHGPAAETLAGRPLAVSATKFTAVVAEVAPDLSGVELVGDADLSMAAVAANQSI